MSKYRKLRTEENNEFVTYFGPYTVAVNSENAKITPYNPVPKQIPSNFNPKIISGIATNNHIYGPTSQGHASLRYYGWGPY